jgi:type I restriction enzyme S subunit
MASNSANGWRRVCLGNVLEQVNRFERMQPEREYRLFGVKWYAEGLFERDRKLGKNIAAQQLNRIEKGDFIYNRLFAWKGSFAIATDEHDGGFVSGEFPVFRAKPDLISAEFLYRYFSRPHTWKLIEHQSMGTTNISRNRWKEDQFLAWPISLPSLECQRQIVSALDTIDGAIQTNEEVLARTRNFKKALAHELLTRGLPGQHTRFKPSLVGMIPEEWKSVKLGEVARVSNGTTPSKLRSDFWENGDIAWLPTGKVNDRIIQSAERFITRLALEQCSLSLLPCGTVLVAMIGQGKTRGMIAYLNVEACINQNFAAIEVGEWLDSWFAFHFLDHKYQALRNSSHGSNQDALNCQILKSYPICLPSLEEQKQIAEILGEVNSYISRTESAIRRAIKVRDELLTALLSPGTERAQTSVFS